MNYNSERLIGTTMVNINVTISQLMSQMVDIKMNLYAPTCTEEQLTTLVNVHDVADVIFTMENKLLALISIQLEEEALPKLVDDIMLDLNYNIDTVNK